MNKLVVFISFICILSLASCSSEEKPYSYLCESDAVAETVDLVFKCNSDTSVFRYAIQSREMCIHWGYSAAPNDYMFFGRNDSIEYIKSIVHSFPSSGEYNINIKAISLMGLNLAKSDLNDITKLNLNNCSELKILDCVGQPISELNLKECIELTELSCGYPGGLQTLSDIGELKKIQKLSINGPINFTVIDLESNDSVKSVSFANSNITDLRITELKVVTYLKIDSCSSFENLTLSNNVRLNEVILSNNILLDGEAINAIFEGLPIATDTSSSITLEGNKGDELCDTSIARSKGWSVLVK